MRKLLRRGATVAGALALTCLTLASADAMEKVSIRLEWVAQSQFAGVYVAQAKGFYKDVGLDATINPGGPNINVETLVASGAEPSASRAAPRACCTPAKKRCLSYVSACRSRGPLSPS